MTWSYLDNCYLGDCAERDRRHRWRKVAMGNTQSAGIDEFGRLFTWGGQAGNGLGMSGHHSSAPISLSPLTYGHDPDTISPQDEMRITKQVGQAHNWVDVQNGEYHTMAMNELGELWVVGNVFDGVAGTDYPDPLNDLYGWSSGPEEWQFQPGGDAGFIAIDLVKVNNSSGIIAWDAFALGWEHCLALKDGDLYIWGWNVADSFGDTVVVADNAIQPDATLVTWIPGTPKIKLIAANLWASVVVTEDDVIYWWGDNVDNGTVATPTVVSGITIPPGETIVQVDITNASGMVARLSDGSIWANGFFDMTLASPVWNSTLTELTAFPSSVHVEVEGFTLASLDADGNIYAIGGFNWFLSRNDASCNITDWDDIYLVQQTNEGDLPAVAFSIGVFNANGLIDYAGYLWTWGQNNEGMLALDETENPDTVDS